MFFDCESLGWFVGYRRDIFYRMGVVDKEIVALSGGECLPINSVVGTVDDRSWCIVKCVDGGAAHTLGRAHSDRSGFEGPWTKEPLLFDNR